jgi:PqqD family protein of HPr-rel-A system
VPVTRPRTRTDLTVVELDGEAVIYDEDSGDLHLLNPPATIVLGLCDGATTMQEMASVISEAFGVSMDEVEPQIRGLVRHFRSAKLLMSSRPVVASRTAAR